GRVEIILPTGGAHQAQIQEKAWNELLDKIKEKWKDDLEDVNLSDVGRGRVQDLIVAITPKIKASDAEVEEYFNQHKDSFPGVKSLASLTQEQKQQII